ncbi:dihydroorotase [Blastocladiella britannica]|nr:dihydroorotase [Blastocladiella britannica]
MLSRLGPIRRFFPTLTKVTRTTMSTQQQEIRLPLAADMHVHLRHGVMMRTVTPALQQTGVSTFLVMPNLVPPITTVAMAQAYKAELHALHPTAEFLMTLYLTPELTPAEIANAAAAGITGVKSYPRGVTTNSTAGVESYDRYYEVFAAMQDHGLILHLHGECPSSAKLNITVMNAEERFLDQLQKLHADFPRLRIILEHATTAAAVELVQRLGDTVAASLTVHHLFLTVDDWAGLPHAFCKPVAKTYADRDALRAIVKAKHPRFFLGTDSAPHPRHAKESARAPAGVFTSLFPLQYLATVMHREGMLDALEGFACVFGRQFYKIPVPTERPVVLTYHPEVDAEGKAVKGTRVPASITVADLEAENEDGIKKPVQVVPFLAGEMLPWTLSVVV